jgi:cyclic beta-1,2-glucan synthetase
LRAAFEKSWNGDWYLRGFFDDGTPLGSATSAECQIDSISQSWSVISGAAELQRARHAMAAVEQHLIKRGDGLVLLLTPPFDKSELEPGYIKGYLPGVRENGGQYTHAAFWTLIAYAMLGDGDRAGELLALLNPINHANTRASLHSYRREPYVVAADIYAKPAGRGGWTWYTGAAAWMYRAALESVLGFKLREGRLVIEPCIPRDWPGFELIYRKGKSQYRIKVENPHNVCRGVATVELDGLSLPDGEVQLPDDGLMHEMRVVLGEKTLARRQTQESADTVKLAT